jgi:beta-phosphoglucomutase family hydrolase
MSEARLEAAIWDMDGVIVDSVEYHFQAWREEFAKKGVDYTMAEFLRHFGQRNDTIIKDAMGAGTPMSVVTAVNDAKQANYRGRIAGHVQAEPGAVELIKALQGRGVRQAIASSSPSENIEVVLGELNIRDCFQATVYGNEVPEGKPSPQIYLRAAEKLGVAPANCVVLEDAIAGVEGARRAGMKCLAVTNSHPGSSLNQADLVTDTLEKVNADTLAALFRRPDVKK